MNIIRQYMHIKTLLILALCFCATISYKLLKGSDIPKNYAVGMINYLEYIGNDKIYFKTNVDVFGLMNASSGALTTVFELEDDQKILEHRGSQFIVIEKNQDINLLVPRDETYFKLKYSQFLQKQNFKEILALKRFSMHDYILTDQFLAKASHLLIMNDAVNKTDGEKFEIIYRKIDPNDLHYKLIYAVDAQPTWGLVVFNQGKSQKSMCVIRIPMQDPQPKRVCTSIDRKLQIVEVTERSPNIQVMTKNGSLVYNQKLQLVEQIQFKDISTHFANMNKAFENKKKNKNELKAKQKQNNKLQYVLPANHVAINVYERYILVRRDDTVLANIEKGPQDLPTTYWTYTRNPNSSKVDIIIQYKDGVVVCYEIDEKTKKYEKLWGFHVSPADKTVAGEKRQAKDSNLQAQQELEQLVKEEDIQINAENGNSQL